MENISLKLDENIARQIEKDLKEFNYSTKTEFIREAIRDKLNELKEKRKRENAWKALFDARGVFRGKGKAKTDEEFRKIREQVGNEFFKKMKKKVSL